jgi:hypothetical protein
MGGIISNTILPARMLVVARVRHYVLSRKSGEKDAERRATSALETCLKTLHSRNKDHQNPRPNARQGLQRREKTA